MNKIKPPNHPFAEVCKTAQQKVSEGWTIYQKWTCTGCNQRLTANNPNTMTELCHCEDCGAITDVTKTGCNYMAIASNVRL